MPNVLVCVKRVPAPGARIVLTEGGRAMDTKNLGFTTSPHEECAVEEAIRLVEEHGGTTTVLTLGPPEAEEQLRYALSVGVQHGVLVSHPSLTGDADWDAQATARALTEAIKALEAAAGTFDLILFGNESADAGGFQVGVRVARALSRPIVNGIKGVALAANAGAASASVEARREGGSGHEVYRLDLPAVLGVKEGLNLPRYPTLSGRLQSKRARVTTHTPTYAPGGQATAGFANPVEQMNATVILGTGPQAATAIVDLLCELGFA